MKINLKRIFFIASFIFNILFLFLLVLAVSGSGKTSSLFVFNPESPSVPYLQSAFIVSVPENDSNLLFGPAEVSLKQGNEAALQFSFLREGRQSNMAIEPLYDHTVISVEPTGFGITVRGVSPGESVVQVFSQGSFRDIAHIIVYE